MWLLVALIIGFIVGLIAKFLMPGRDPSGFIITSLLGIGGSLVAAFLGRTLGWYLPGEPVGFIASIIGAMIILAVYRAVRSKKV
jgi:uncharacterized membrane protein YeaQ/YmgE (transglycosylase-associated protein family)